VDKWVEEILPDEGTEVLGCYAGDHFTGVPVLTRRRHGAGEAYYLGTILSPEQYYAFYSWLLPRLGLEPAMQLPEDVHLACRAKPGTTLHFLSNDTSQPREVELPREYVDAVTGEAVGERLTLPGWDVRVLRPAEEIGQG
jgi:beta-galactosidase